jgi:hypothetical protein
MSIQVWHQPESGRIASKLQAVGNGERREGLELDVPGATGATGVSAYRRYRRVGPKGLGNLAQALAWVALNQRYVLFDERYIEN